MDEDAFGESSKSKVSLSKGKVWEALFNQKTLQERRCKLTWWKFLCIVLYQQIAFNDMLYLIDSFFEWRSILVVVSYYLLSIFIGMPFLMITIFLGSYTKKSYLKVWKIRPFVQGFGYSVMIAIYIQENVNLATAGLGLIYMREIFSGKRSWNNINCSIVNVSDACYPFIIGRNKIEDANVGFSYKTGYKLGGLGSGLDLEIFKNINSYWVFHIFCLWIFIYLATIIGYEKFSISVTKFTKYSIILVYIPTFVVIAWGGQTNTVPEYFKLKWFDLYSFEFWEDMLANVLGCVIPGNLLLLSTYMSFNIDVCDITYIVQGTKFAIIAMILTGTIVVISKLQRLHDIKFTKLKGFDVFFVMVPTLLDEVGSNVLTILWFFIIIIWSLIPSILTILGIIDTMTENFPMLMKYRICFCTFTNLLCFTISACVLTENFLPNVHIWSSTGWPALCAVMIVIYTLIIFIHSMKKIALAYTTVYIKSLGKFWQNFLTLGQTIVICLVLYKIYTNYTLSIQGHTKTVTMLSVLIVVVCFLPILLGVIWIFGKSKNIKDPNTSTIRKVSSLKQKRKLLLSGHYEMIRCEHNCLLNSKKLEELIVAADIKNKFISNYIEDNRKNK